VAVSEAPQLPVAPAPPVEINPTKTGTSLLGTFNVLPYPQLVIDGPGGDALYVQVADPGTGRGNLHFSRRTGGTSSTLAQVPQNEHVSNPSLALTGGAKSSSGVVVYQATTLSDLGTATIDEVLNSQEIRWRYHDGTNWGSEHVLESNCRFDGKLDCSSIDRTPSTTAKASCSTPIATCRAPRSTRSGYWLLWDVEE
jgi:hypothetical protein